MIEIIGLALVGIICIALLVLSAEYVVKKLIIIAKHYGVSDVFIGLTVLSIGTSLPEIASHFISSIGIVTGKLDYNIASATVLGANIGSDVIQQTLILGVVILLVGHLTFTKKFLFRSYSVMIGTTLMCLVLGWDQHYSRIDGFILFSTFLAYMYYLYKHEDMHQHVDHQKKKYNIHKQTLFAILGLGVLLVSSTIILKLVEHIVIMTQIGGSLIGVMSLGIASALPELITALQGVKNKARGISIGTLIGSNITNPLVAIGGGALISTYFVPKPLIYWDLPMETVTATILLIYLLFNKRKLGKGGAIYLIALYLVYAVVRIMIFNVD
ncbi:MAG: cation:H+ antiporter [Candidatus Woesearchaeota archaeon]|jgi:cation:H+ antiporter